MQDKPNTSAAIGKITPKKVLAGPDGKPLMINGDVVEVSGDAETQDTKTAVDSATPKPPEKKRQSRWGAEERQFLPAALEIMETPAHPLGRIIAITLAAFFSIAVLWTVIGEVDVVAVATGKIVPTGGVKKIQALEIGTVRAIHVRDGQHVNAGDLLIELDPTDSEVDKGQMLRQLHAAQLDIARLTANLEGIVGRDAGLVPPGNVDGLMLSIARQQLESDLLTHQAQIAGLDAEHAKRRADYAAIQSEVAKLHETMPLIIEREEALHVLVNKGISPKPKWLEVKQFMIETRHNIEIQTFRLAEAKAGMLALEKERDRMVAEAQQKALDELVEARDNQEAALLALRKADKKETQRNLISPVEGVVQQLVIHTIGGVVTPADPLMLIIPDNAPLEIQAQLLNKDAGFVEAGQEAEIKIDSFPFTKYGTIDGHIRHLSKDAILDENLGPIFDIRVSMEATEIFADGRMVQLTPGMTASIEVKTGKRKIIEFLLSPIMRYQSEALRER